MILVTKGVSGIADVPGGHRHSIARRTRQEDPRHLCSGFQPCGFATATFGSNQVPSPGFLIESLKSQAVAKASPTRP